ncbi:formate dehydrogenase subunit delta [Novosphingobium sp. PASSN1]|uniref:formate dehydrogenase subunit delta n=1 Tax=Novosphingobium sp. PASSN1 TaxID=2015561 RepID=UPI000BDB5BF3|nr:formate dehydrogenase subunit delta [Novosphingobium sp. PASSN1]OYU33234.1 MAG: formate dehydrogenase [Novosphingobium sp. PASSN1]
MSAHTTEKLIYMANQIARNVTHEADPVAMIADHIHAFWSVRMKADVFAVLDGPAGAALDPVARAALERLAAHAG